MSNLIERVMGYLTTAGFVTSSADVSRRHIQHVTCI